MSVELAELLKQSSARHSHLCPRQVLGVRMGLAGLRTLGVPAPMPKKEALVFIETDGCFADGIEVATGANIGHRTLRVVDLGKIAATFVNVETGLALRLAPRLDVRLRALEFAPQVKQKYRAQLKGYQVMPEAELFSFQQVTLQPDLAEVISRMGLRAKCAQCGEEIINGREVHAEGNVLCRTCAWGSYYRPGEALR